MTKLILLLCAALCTTTHLVAQNTKATTTLNFTVSQSDWRPVGKSGNPGCYASDTLFSDALTKAAFDNGAVLVYVLGTSGGGWYLLPHTYFTSGVQVTTNFNYQVGYVELRTYSAANKISPPKNTLKYKIVVLNDEK
jgi:hypothetical protein